MLQFCSVSNSLSHTTLSIKREVYFSKKCVVRRPYCVEYTTNTHPNNYHNLKGKDIDVHFLFQVEELYCELNYHDQKIRRTFARDIRKYWTCFDLMRYHQQCIS